MNIGFIGAGKLGLPVALAVDAKGHNVCVTDINRYVKGYLIDKMIPYQEEGVPELLQEHNVDFVSNIDAVYNRSDIIFLAIQTPHNERFEGVTPLPEDRADFSYEYLIDAIQEISEVADEWMIEKTVVIISTVLPGTIEREIKPHLSEYLKLCYNPFFIAMGTTVRDFLNPEFVLLGYEDIEAANHVKEFYSTLHDRPIYDTSIINAEMIKVCYNTFISTKIAYANTIMELCHKVGADVDAVTNAIKMATSRLISTAYLSGGAGDGGGCHPRDNIAMSWLAKKHNLSHDLFEDIMLAREDQSAWLASIISDYVHANQGMRVIIMGLAFKENTNLITGSPSMLLIHQLEEGYGIYPQVYDPNLPKYSQIPTARGIYFVVTKHREFIDFPYPSGSIVIDLWRFVKVPNNVQYVPIGKPN
jgi:UDPglucose 6-dehydrogenase